jgi:hypothetical protein
MMSTSLHSENFAFYTGKVLKYYFLKNLVTLDSRHRELPLVSEYLTSVTSVLLAKLDFQVCYG